jgi:predicted transcriptional regulator
VVIADTNDIAENKLILLCIAEEMALPMSKRQFSDIVIKGNLMNYFVMQHILDSLLEIEYMEKTEDKFFITEKGSETLSFLTHKIPQGIKRYITNLAASFRNSVKKELEIKTNYTFGNADDFISNLEISENGSPLLQVSFCAGTKKEAKKICDSFKKHSDEFYYEIMNTLLKNRD